MHKLEDILSQLGLSEKETKVYLALLQLEHSTVQWIAKKSGINRTTVYDILETLQQKGLARFYVKKGGKYFVAADPEKLVEMEEQKMQKQQSLLENLKKGLPELLSIYNSKKIKPKIQFFDSSEHLEEMYMNMYGQGKAQEDCIEYASWGEKPEVLPDIFPQETRNKLLEHRKKHKIFIRQVAIKSNYTKDWIKPEYGKKRFKEVRLISKNGFDFGANLETYNNRIIIVQFNKETGLTGILIESRELCQMIRTMFEFMWQAAK